MIQSKLDGWEWLLPRFCARTFCVIVCMCKELQSRKLNSVSRSLLRRTDIWKLAFGAHSSLHIKLFIKLNLFLTFLFVKRNWNSIWKSVSLSFTLCCCCLFTRFVGNGGSILNSKFLTYLTISTKKKRWKKKDERECKNELDKNQNKWNIDFSTCENDFSSEGRNHLFCQIILIVVLWIKIIIVTCKNHDFF